MRGAASLAQPRCHGLTSRGARPAPRWPSHRPARAGTRGAASTRPSPHPAAAGRRSAAAPPRRAQCPATGGWRCGQPAARGRAARAVGGVGRNASGRRVRRSGGGGGRLRGGAAAALTAMPWCCCSAWGIAGGCCAGNSPRSTCSGHWGRLFAPDWKAESSRSIRLLLLSIAGRGASGHIGCPATPRRWGCVAGVRLRARVPVVLNSAEQGLGGSRALLTRPARAQLEPQFAQEPAFVRKASLYARRHRLDQLCANAKGNSAPWPPSLQLCRAPRRARRPAGPRRASRRLHAGGAAAGRTFPPRAAAALPPLLPLRPDRPCPTCTPPRAQPQRPQPCIRRSSSPTAAAAAQAARRAVCVAAAAAAPAGGLQALIFDCDGAAQKMHTALAPALQHRGASYQLALTPETPALPQA